MPTASWSRRKDVVKLERHVYLMVHFKHSSMVLPCSCTVQARMDAYHLLLGLQDYCPFVILVLLLLLQKPWLSSQGLLSDPKMKLYRKTYSSQKQT